MQLTATPSATATATAPAAPPSKLPFDPQEVVDRGVAIARRMYARLDPAGDDGIGRMGVDVHGGSHSQYNRLTNTISIGAGNEKVHGPNGELELLETTIHETTHHWTDHRAGVGGLFYAGGPGRLSEGLSQVMAGAALVLEGETQQQRDWGWFLLDPRGKTTPMPSELPWGHKRDIPLSVTMDDVRKGGFTLKDNGYVHVHSGVIQAAHLEMAKAIGMEPMARITTDAARTSLGQFTGFHAWADATIAAAARLHGEGSPQQAAVRHAWEAVKLLQPA
jgi:hypothetical protein